MINFEDLILSYYEQELDTIGRVDEEEIKKACDYILDAIRMNRTIYCFGNGGSASTASHLANDFNKILHANCICLNDNVPTIMAVANDIGYDTIFKFQLENKLKPKDIIIAISGSGNSANIINAILYAKKHNAIIIGLTGFDGGALKALSDINLWAPVNNMQIAEDLHLTFNHVLVSTLSKFLN